MANTEKLESVLTFGRVGERRVLLCTNYCIQLGVFG